MNQPLLVELFTEELPPKALERLGRAFADGIQAGLVSRGLSAADAAVTPYATPRRLAVRIENVADQAADRTETKKLMPSKVGFDASGAPTAALAKRLEKEGAAAGDCERRMEGDAEYVFLERRLPGVGLAEGLQASLLDSIAKLPIPKVMGYQLADGETTVHFVRPAHGLVALHGADVVPVSALGLSAGRVTQGHRFQGARDIAIADVDAYVPMLVERGQVIPSFAERRAAIDTALRTQAAAFGASLGPETDFAPLLDEVTALVEFPTVYAGQFEEAFLAVPQECLILTMRQNQKYFPLFDAGGRLTHRFLIVSNMRLANPVNIVTGNERVVRPRLADARFFFETDKKTRLEYRVPQLASVVYHNKLGTQGERSERVAKLATEIARMIGADPAQAERAARLAKADLVTGMVGEFPELQGIMGRYYALADDEAPAVAEAIEQHYRPRFAGDALPDGPVSMTVALADKLETLAGLFGIGQLPTGDKDPFALRRHALGVIRMLIEAGLPADLDQLVAAAFAAFPAGKVADAHTDLETFVFERLHGYLADQGYTTNEIEAVLSQRPVRLALVPKQLAAVRAFAAVPEAKPLAAANKRIGNILRKTEGDWTGADAAVLVEPAEQALLAAYQAAVPRFEALFDAQDYAGALQSLAPLKMPVDAFFDGVMVMADDAKLRENRLALLSDLRRLMNRVADLSRLAT
jgi:glycyl-tRNA synthetase beta chain